MDLLRFLFALPLRDGTLTRMIVHSHSDSEKVTAKVMPLLRPQGLQVAGSYRAEAHVLDGRKVRVVVPEWNAPGQRDCWPVMEPRLAEDFAAVTDERSLVEFVG